MTELTELVTDAAFNRAETAMIQTNTLEAALDAAAPLIVAAELERLSDEWHAIAKHVALTEPAKGLTCQGFANALRARARDLRGEV